MGVNQVMRGNGQGLHNTSIGFTTFHFSLFTFHFSLKPHTTLIFVLREQKTHHFNILRRGTIFSTKNKWNFINIRGV